MSTHTWHMAQSATLTQLVVYSVALCTFTKSHTRSLSEKALSR